MPRALRGFVLFCVTRSKARPQAIWRPFRMLLRPQAALAPSRPYFGDTLDSYSDYTICEVLPYEHYVSSNNVFLLHMFLLHMFLL